MSKVVIYGRTSTKTQNMGYQISSLIDICTEKKWEIVKSFRDVGISGLVEDSGRPEFMNMMEFVRKNDVDKIIVSEISRIGRNVDYVKKILCELSELGISVFISDLCRETLINGKLDPNTLAILYDEIAHANKEILKLQSRLKRGYDEYRKSGRRVGRTGGPETSEKFLFKHSDVIRYLMDGFSLRAVSIITNKSTTTIMKVKKLLVETDSYIKPETTKTPAHLLKLLLNDETTKNINKNILTVQHQELELKPRYIPVSSKIE
jgi:DNA invertase Pin-like site-specific DNA recombinase